MITLHTPTQTTKYAEICEHHLNDFVDSTEPNIIKCLNSYLCYNREHTSSLPEEDDWNCTEIIVDKKHLSPAALIAIAYDACDNQKAKELLISAIKELKK
jgi:hypothetical protein